MRSMESRDRLSQLLALNTPEMRGVTAQRIQNIQTSLYLLNRVKPLTPTLTPFEYIIPDGQALLSGLNLPMLPVAPITDVEQARQIILRSSSNVNTPWKRAFTDLQIKASESFGVNQYMGDLFLNVRLAAKILAPSMREMQAQGELGYKCAKRYLAYAQFEAVRNENDPNPLLPLVKAGIKGGHVLGIQRSTLWIYTPKEVNP